MRNRMANVTRLKVKEIRDTIVDSSAEMSMHCTANTEGMENVQPYIRGK